jgi:hypothetical protein
MTQQQWRIRVSGRPKKRPDIDLLVQAVLALAGQLQQEREEHRADPTESPSEPPQEA